LRQPLDAGEALSAHAFLGQDGVREHVGLHVPERCIQLVLDAIIESLDVVFLEVLVRGSRSYSRAAMAIVSLPWRGQESPSAEWQSKVQLNHAFGDAGSQSLECDG